MTLVDDKYPLETERWPNGTLSWALFGPEQTEDDFYKYRYGLGRRWDEGEGSLLWIMLNPSTADALNDDPTVSRCRKFAQKWGYKEVLVGNIFGLRSPDPDTLYDAKDPVGPDNDRVLRDILIPKSDKVIAAWGNHGQHLNRSEKLLDGYLGELDLHAVTVNSTGEPGHPLYLPKDSEPFKYEPSTVR